VPLTPSQEAVLYELAARVPDGVRWCIFGSVDSVLRGLDDDPSDVDVLTTATGARQFREAFSCEFVGTREVGTSRLDEYRVHGEELEVISGKGEGDDREPLVDLNAVEFETSVDRAVPMLPLEPLVDAYRRIDKHDAADGLEAEFGSTDG